jgi:hypothetical protein
MDKINEIIEFAIVKRIREAGVERLISTPMRNCKLNDFTSRNYIPNNQFKLNLKNMICMDFEKMKSLFVKNLYHHDNRESFHISINRCSRERKKNCKNEEQSNEFLR